MSARREARRRVEPDLSPILTGTAALMAGPRTDVWGADIDDLIGARRAWRDARDQWAKDNGITQYRRLPRDLRDRAPFRPDRKANR